MWTTYDTTQALVKARNASQTLESHKKSKPSALTEGNQVGNLLETIAAVVPTGVITIYTGVALVLRGDAVSRAETESANLAAVMRSQEKSAAAIKKALEALPPESDQLIVLRWALLAVAALAAAALVWKAAHDANHDSERQRSFVAAEPLAACIAFVSWSLATPGTPIAALYTSSDTNVISATIAGIGALILLTMGAISLSRPANVRPN